MVADSLVPQSMEALCYDLVSNGDESTTCEIKRPIGVAPRGQNDLSLDQAQ